MKGYEFPAWCSFGKGDSGESIVYFELTDEEAARLEATAKDPDIYYDGFYEAEDLADIYKKVYAAAVEQITDELRDADLDIPADENWEADDTYAVGVEFPTEFEDLFEEDEDFDE